MRDWMLTLALCACRPHDDAGHPPVASVASAFDAGVAPALPPSRAYADLATALLATVPADARVIGFGELHERTDRASPGTSTLAALTQALPAIGDRISDLVVETWLVDPKCGRAAVAATARLESAVKRPGDTKPKIASLADVARAAGIQPHAMSLSCADYAELDAGSGANPEGNIEVMLSFTTRELTRIAVSAVHHRDRAPTHRPWIAVYGGALHNDRFPDPGVAEWSYAAEVDRQTGGHFVEVDLIAPAIAAVDPASQRAPWFPLIDAPVDPARPVRVWQRDERSYVVVLAPSVVAGVVP